MHEVWETQTGLTPEEFAKFTAFCNRSDNERDNVNRARLLGLTSENVRVAPGAIIRLHHNGKIGRNTMIGLYTYVNGDVSIGENVLIGPHCSITSNNHVFLPAQKWFGANHGAPISIGDGSWLASGCVVTAGVSIGKYNLICANTVVTKSTPDYAIMAGTPARQAGRIDQETGAHVWYKRGHAPQRNGRSVAGSN